MSMLVAFVVLAAVGWFVATAPQEAIQIMLAGAWALGILALLAEIAIGLFRVVF